MADTEKAAPAASNPAADVAKTESSAEVKVDTTANDAKDAGEEKWSLNGKSEDRSERSERRGDRNDRNGRFNDRRGGGGFRGRGGRGGFPNKYKKRNQEFDDLPESDDPVEIRNQVEFYFSTQNLVTDEHLFMELGGPKNMPVSIKHIADFKRMRRFQPYSAIVDALRESKDLVVVDNGDYNGAGKEAVKRKEPLVVPNEESDETKEPSTTDLFYRLKNASSNKLETSVYVKGFGDEKEAGQIALEQFFRPYGSVMVRKRRDDDNSWKGSVFVEFDTEDSQKQFLELDPKPKFNDNELTIMGKREYIIMKCKEKGVEPDFESKKQYNRGSRDNRDGGRGGRGGRARGRGGNRGGDRRDTRSNRRDRSRDRRDRSGSVDERDWNKRRDRFNNGKDDRGSRKEEKEERKPMQTDADGVPVVKDTRTEAEIKKRKAEDDGGEDSKKSKLEIKQDE